MLKAGERLVGGLHPVASESRDHLLLREP
ncbi:hypothetical protein JOD67_006790 [Tenggerimyces flavus]|nr:hypothetical protein [Tenggerimyces flavus]